MLISLSLFVIIIVTTILTQIRPLNDARKYLKTKMSLYYHVNLCAHRLMIFIVAGIHHPSSIIRACSVHLQQLLKRSVTLKYDVMYTFPRLAINRYEVLIVMTSQQYQNASSHESIFEEHRTTHRRTVRTIMAPSYVVVLLHIIPKPRLSYYPSSAYPLTEQITRYLMSLSQ